MDYYHFIHFKSGNFLFIAWVPEPYVGNIGEGKEYILLTSNKNEARVRVGTGVNYLMN